MRDNTGSSIAHDAPDRLERYRYAFRNENYLYRQEGVRGVCYYLAKCALNLLRIARDAQSFRLRRWGIILSQMLGGILFNPPIEFVKPEEETLP
jgi:hypothetical protein